MKNLLLTITTVLLFTACSKKENNGNLHITGNIKGLKNGTLYIQRYNDSTLVAIDTITIDDKSNFETSINIDSPEMLYLFLDRGVTNSLDNNILFFAEPGKINIKTELDSYLSSAKITGSKNQEVYEEYKKLASKFKDESLDLIQAKFYATKFQNIPKLDSINKKIEQNIKRKYLYTANFALNHKDAEASPYIVLSEIHDINLKYLDTIQKTMSKKVGQSLYGKKLTNYVTEIKNQDK
jgi:rRNA-processing protein FCF1